MVAHWSKMTQTDMPEPHQTLYGICDGVFNVINRPGLCDVPFRDSASATQPTIGGIDKREAQRETFPTHRPDVESPTLCPFARRPTTVEYYLPTTNVAKWARCNSKYQSRYSELYKSLVDAISKCSVASQTLIQEWGLNHSSSSRLFLPAALLRADLFIEKSTKMIGPFVAWC
ncbi:kinase-like domain [Cordyceps militaris]|uniref:Kinase-like domain n=1 Tax=Cordyceps militaris TaxID=73501 RepID=A0A2H4SI97_CORMI|nr:kinase-like domain [Cordyceps militaris]